MREAILLFLLVVLMRSELNDVDMIKADLSFLDSSLIDIVWCGQDKASDDKVLLLSSKGSVYRSDDKGSTWIKLAEVFHKKGIVSIDDANVKIGVVNKIQRSLVDPQLVIFLGTEAVNWISPDCGVSVNALYTGRSMRDFQFHPSRKEWLLSSSWSKCDSMKKKDCFVTKDLMISRDLGQSWDILASYINQYSWGAKNKQMIETIPETRILITYEPTAKGHQRVSGWSMQTHFYYTDDFFNTTTIVVNSGNKFLLTNSFLFVAQVMNAMNQEVTLLVANPNEAEYNFRYTQLPEILKEHSYTILDTSDGSVFLNINHIVPNSLIGTIYISDSTGTRYSLSLDNNVRTQEGQCDFEKVLGLEGIYIANVYAKQEAELQKSSFSEESRFQSKNFDLNRFKQTRITFDKGARWQKINPPLRDSEGKRITCDDCSLHLHSVSTKLQYGPFYSTQNSIGVIIGTGNIGNYLSYRSDQVNTFLSRDGGLEWFEIAKGSHIYEIGDHGGVIVLANDQQATKVIKYSWDEGLHWEDFQFSETPVEITNIITEPSNTATRFIIYGTTFIASNKIEQGVVVTVDFGSIHSRECEGIDNPGAIESDYEEWTPNGKINPKCLMGKQVTYIRKKRDAQCFNGEEMERKKFIEYCQCTEEDWECDLGFHRENDGEGPCQPNPLFEVDYSPPEKCDDFYYVSQGYRKVAGNQCEGGIEYNYIQLPCPGFKFFRIRSFWDIALILILCGVFYFIYTNRLLFKNLIPKANNNQQQPSKSARLYGQNFGKGKEQQLQNRGKNSGGLGYREFDEDLLEKDEENNAA